MTSAGGVPYKEESKVNHIPDAGFKIYSRQRMGHTSSVHLSDYHGCTYLGRTHQQRCSGVDNVKSRNMPSISWCHTQFGNSGFMLVAVRDSTQGQILDADVRASIEQLVLFLALTLSLLFLPLPCFRSLGLTKYYSQFFN